MKTAEQIADTVIASRLSDSQLRDAERANGSEWEAYLELRQMLIECARHTQAEIAREAW